jgi:hypothetical protein
MTTSLGELFTVKRQTREMPTSVAGTFAQAVRLAYRSNSIPPQAGNVEAASMPLAPRITHCYLFVPRCQSFCTLVVRIGVDEHIQL